MGFAMFFLATSSVSHAAEGAEPEWWFLTTTVAVGLFVWYFFRRHFFVKEVVVTSSGESVERFKPAFEMLQEFSVFLLVGVVVSQLWVHQDSLSYETTMKATIFTLSSVNVTPHFLVNEVFMALFFGIAAKELSEAFLKPGGDLRGRKGILPGFGCAGGVLGPIAIYLLLSTPEQKAAWGVPCATDIAFAWLGARLVWGGKHPAVLFLLALAVADDFVGMGIIAVQYPQHEFHLVGIFIILGGMMTAWGWKRLAL